MKKFLLLLASASLLFAGCAKELSGSAELAGGEVEVTVNAKAAGVDSKAVADYDGNAKTVNHWVMEVRDVQGNLYTRQEKDAAAGTLQQTFTVTLLKNQTYDFQFWADTKGNYNTDDLTAVSVIGSVANNDARDAFSCNKNYKSTKSETIQATLTRPFAQLNVITTDLEDLWTTMKGQINRTEYDRFEPYNFMATAKVPTTFNVKTQACGAATEEVILTADKCYIGYENDETSPKGGNNYYLHLNPATLFMDYIFASAADKDIVDIDFGYYSNNEPVVYMFTAIPLQRNYRTNIKGRLMSNESTWEVVIDPIWNQPDFDVPYFEATVKTIEELNGVLSSSKAGAAKDLTLVAETPNDSDQIPVKFTSNNNGQNIKLGIGSELGAGKTVKLQNTGEGPANLDITAAPGTNLDFVDEFPHAIINGTSYDNITGSFSANTLVINEGVEVKKLSIAKGGLEIYGTVLDAEVTGTKEIVFVRDCKGLSTDVYAVLHAYIAKGYVGVQEGEVWNIVPEENWLSYAAKSFSQIDEASKTITIISAEEFALIAKKLSADRNALNGYTVQLGNNIDLSAHTWVPQNVTGVKFIGNNHPVKGLKVNQNSNYLGLFGAAFDVDFKTFVLDYPSIKGTVGARDYAGGLFGNGYARVEDCKVLNARIFASEQVGGICGYLSCGYIKNSLVEDGIIRGTNRVGGICGKANTDSEYLIEGNTVRNTELVSTDRHDLSGAAAIVAQIMTDEAGNWGVISNTADNVSTTTAQNSTFVPVGEFRNESFRADGNNRIYGNRWINVVASDFYKMKDPSNPSAYITIENPSSIDSQIAKAQVGDVVKVYGVNFVKSDDEQLYTDPDNKKGRLVQIKIASPGSPTSNTMVVPCTDPDKTPVSFQTLLLGSESRLDAPGTLLKSGDILVLPATILYLNKGVIYDVYGDITFLGAGKDNTIIKPYYPSGSSYRFFRIYNRYKKNVDEGIVYHYNFKNLTIDGELDKNASGNAFVVTCYNIQINVENCAMNNFGGAVFSIWANDTMSPDGSYPTKAQCVGVEVNLKKSEFKGNGKLVHYDARPYKSDVKDGIDRYAFIHLFYDDKCVLDNTQMYSFNDNTAKGQGNCLLNGVDVYPAE